MSALADHLIELSVNKLTDTERAEWDRFLNLLNQGTDLETALYQINLSEDLTELVIQTVWDLIKSKDKSVFEESLNNNKLFPLGRLFTHMFKSSIDQINVITTNYDRLIEYACDQENLHHYTAFSYGFKKQLDFPRSFKIARIVNVWKVHGSIDWFNSKQGQTLSISALNQIPPSHHPLIITPGIHKYQRTHLEPYRTIIGAADNALENATSFLCFGFGFNDEHIQPKLLSKCQNDNASIIIVTKALTEKTIQLLQSGNLKNYVAIECNEINGGSIIHSSIQGKLTVTEEYWTMDGFLSLIM